ncbi:MAG: hypothetical protein JRL30_16350 [Deltaproteobacteria bacterium]|nr:hypothetical protein [Deltaproteobacteria bacterium]
MGEIRSTLDIIMEKAKDVTVTDEEKKAFMMREVEGKVRGLLQKYLDGGLKKERLDEDLHALSDDRYEMAVAALTRECLARMVLDGDNRALLDVLGGVAGVDTRPVEELLLQYQQDHQARRADREAVLRERLEDQGISGSAVIANLAADPEWIDYLSKEKDRFHQSVATFNTKG